MTEQPERAAGVPGARQERQEETARRPRNPKRSRRSILNAAKAEFCRYGFNGARVERISRKSKTNTRMIYHYFGSKEGVYLAVLETVYADIRKKERKLDLTNAEPLEGMRKLIGFTLDFFARRSDFIALISNENILKAKYLRRLSSIRAMTMPLVATIRDLLERGQQRGIFRAGIDPVQFYISIVAQSQLHISNRFTLSVLFDRDLTDADWLAERRAHTLELLTAYLAARAVSDQTVERQ